MSLYDYVGTVGIGIGSYILAAFVGKPIRAYWDLKEEIAKCLVFYANADSVARADDPLVLEAERKYRDLASTLTGIANGIPAYGLWAMLRLVPSLQDLEDAKSNLIGLSNGIGVPSRSLDNSKRHERIRKALGIVLAT
jgi:hypothetical protein